MKTLRHLLRFVITLCLAIGGFGVVVYVYAWLMKALVASQWGVMALLAVAVLLLAGLTLLCGAALWEFTEEADDAEDDR